MSRRFLDDIKADIDTQMADNASGNFTLTTDRALRNDIIDSLYEANAVIYSNVQVPGPFATATTFQPLGGLVYDTQKGDDSAGEGFLRADLTNGLIRTHETIAGFIYKAQALITFVTVANVLYEFSISLDGVPKEHVAAVRGQPGADEVTLSVHAYSGSAPLDSEWQIEVRTPEEVSQMTNVSAYLLMGVMPTTDPAPP